MRAALPIVETVAGLGLVAGAVSQLLAGARTFPSLAQTLVLLVVLLVGIALIYLGFASRRDARDAAGRSHKAPRRH